MPLTPILPPLPITSEGDLVAGAVSGAPARLPAGTATQVLRVAADGTGLEYHTPDMGDLAAGGGLLADGWFRGPAGYRSVMDRFNVRSYGAVGDGVADDTAAIEAAWDDAVSTDTGFYDPDGNSVYRLVGPSLYFPAGNYRYAGTGLILTGDIPTFAIRGDGPESTRITLPAGRWLIDTDAFLDKFSIRGLQVKGGAGLLRHSQTGASSGRVRFLIADVVCKDYTVCAIGSLASDSPYWTIRDCWFSGDAAAPNAIGIALAGDRSGSTIDTCHFMSTRYGIKLGRNGFGVRIRGCDFINRSHTGSHAKIWIVPSAVGFNDAGVGAWITESKFGNEFLIAGDYHILVADEDAASGADLLTRGHSAAASVGWVRQWHVLDNEFSGTGTAPDVPVVYSTTDKVSEFQVTDNKFNGTVPSYVLKLLDGKSDAATRTVATNLLGPNIDWAQGREVVGTIRPSSVPGYGVARDPFASFLDAEEAVAVYPGAGSDPEYLPLLVAAVSTFSVLNSVTPTYGQTDATGGTNAALLDYTGTTGQWYHAVTGFTLNRPVWVEFDLRSTGASPLASVEVRLQQDAARVWFRRFLAPQTGWRHYRFLWHPTRATGLNLLFTSAVAGQVLVGRPFVYHAREPVDVGRALARVSADNGDAAATLTAGTSAQTQRWNTPLTAARAVTLSTTAGAYNGAAFRIVREAGATGAFFLNVGPGPLAALVPSEWCDVAFDGTAWRLMAQGGLANLLVGSKTYDWPSVSANNSASTTVAVPGAALGDLVSGVSMDVDLAGAVLTAHVSAADTVTAVLRAGSGAGVDLPSGLIRVQVRKAS